MNLLEDVQSVAPTADPDLIKRVIARNFVAGNQQLTIIRSILSEELAPYISPWTRNIYRLSYLYPGVPINKIAIFLRRNWNLGERQAYLETVKHLQRVQQKRKLPLSISY